jgi:hypothetical protein
MLKKFSISLIIMSTFLYGSIYFMSKKYDTTFFDEILIQLNRMTANFNKSQEAQFTKIILTTIINNEHPPSNWNRFIAHNAKYSHKELFYYYKVWSIKVKLNLEDINSSYPIFTSNSEKVMMINMRYGKSKPVVRFPFYKNKKGDMVAGLFFPVNEKPFSADLNKDKKINHQDVIIARKPG